MTTTIQISVLIVIMRNNRGGRPQGRPKKEYSEYVPKGIDPIDTNQYEKKESYADHDRPTEGNFDQHRNYNKNYPESKRYDSRGGIGYNNTRSTYESSYKSSRDNHGGYRTKYYEGDRGRGHRYGDEYSDQSGDDYESSRHEKQKYRGGKEKTQENGLQPYKKRETRREEEEEENENEKGKVVYQWRECVVCLLKCSPTSAIWCCQACRITCHLKCIKDWIFKQNNVQTTDSKNVDRSKVYPWTCPHCQAQKTEPLPSYYCFCGKVRNPKSDTYKEPHSCGGTCGRKRGGLCRHLCQIECHSGACPPCEIVLPEITCFCGKETKERVCGDMNKRTCGNKCEKKLSCGSHFCEKPCHDGDCPPCPKIAMNTCHCGKTDEERPCGQTFSCGGICNRFLNCEVHRCVKLCHER